MAGKLPVKVVWLCGGKTADIMPEQPYKFSMEQAQENIKRHRCRLRMKSQMATIFDFGKFEVSLFDGGRMLIKNTVDEESTMRAYREILQVLQISI